MRSADEVRRFLVETGALWSPLDGVTGLRGPVVTLLRRIETTLAELAASETEDEWRVPALLPLEVLARADYFASFPQWLTVASHLTHDEDALAAVACADAPEAAVRDAIAPPRAALPPAVCYHVYAALQGRRIEAPLALTAQGICWRHEGDRLAALERNWPFTMREIVCLGTAEQVGAFRERGRRAAERLAERMDLGGHVVDAADPFFAPTGRGKEILQRIKGLKRELLLPIGDDRTIAAASFNLHETFFGEAFDVTLSDGSPAHSACVAFGLERWVLAYLVRHGVEPEDWPILARAALTGTRS